MVAYWKNAYAVVDFFLNQAEQPNKLSDIITYSNICFNEQNDK